MLIYVGIESSHITTPVTIAKIIIVMTTASTVSFNIGAFLFSNFSLSALFSSLMNLAHLTFECEANCKY